MIIISYLLLVYIIAIVMVIVFSWFPMAQDGPGHQIFVLLRRMTDPVLEPVRRIIPPIGGALDVSPMIVLFVLFTLRSLI
ncbi:MAG: YggT family protein [Aquihabitans sp.]